MISNDDELLYDDDVLVVASAILWLAWVGARFVSSLHRAAALGSSEERAPKRRKVEEKPRVYARSEDGEEGLRKTRVKDPDHPVGWKKYVSSRHLSTYLTKKFRQQFRLPPSLFWQLHDKAVSSGSWRMGDLHETGENVGRGTPIPLAYKV